MESQPRWMARARSALVPAAVVGLLGWWSIAIAGAQAPRSVVWLDHAAPAGEGGEGAAREERERALRLELQARDFVLLEASDPDASADQDKAELLERSGATAVMWLEAEVERPVSWLFVRTRGSAEAAKAPLPHPPDAIDPRLLAIAAASLLDQTLSEPQAPAPPPPVATPAEAAATVAVRPTPSPIAPLPADAAYEAESERRFFLQLGFVDVQPGMEAASKPRLEDVYNISTVNRGGVSAPAYLFDDAAPYVPDADSFDDYEERDSFSDAVIIPRGTTPVSTLCEADGIATSAGEMPSRFCVRVEGPGIAPAPALRLGVGMWVLPKLALVVAYQLYFLIEPERLPGSQSIALEGRYLLAGERGRGFSFAVLAALSYGRDETPVPSDIETVNALSGPFGVWAGLPMGFAFSPEWALVFTPRVAARFPASQFELDLGLVVERTF